MNHQTDQAKVDPSTTQTVVPDLIAALFKANTEVVQPSQGPAVTVQRDPHLRLRRTLTPSSPITGLKKYNEAQFMITGSTGKRETVQFSVGEHIFQMDVYVWKPTGIEPKHRMVALHGVSPGVSRTRWHGVGERLAAEQGVHFVALDWHSIDRTDQPQTAFLTMLPKHILSAPSNPQKMINIYPADRREWAKALFDQIQECCPRSYREGADILRAVIEQGLGWANKPFILGIKSWSGGVGVKLLADATRENGQFKKHIAGAVIMHPASFDEHDARDAVKSIPTLMCWAKDDPLMPYELSRHFTANPKVSLVTYEMGGHANFDGSQNLPNFDDRILKWIQGLPSY